MGNYESKGQPFISSFPSSYIHESDVNDEKRLGQISIYSKVTDSNDFVAVKTYPKQALLQMHTFQLFYNSNGQFVGSAQNEHPNITKLYAYDISQDQQITLYLEYCHTTIRDQIDLRSKNMLHFSPEELWRTALSVIMAGYFLELQGRFIGDVNTRRIFLTKKGIVKVVPCMQTQRDTDCLQRAGFFGDHSYLPPELLIRLKKRDLLSGNQQNFNKADVFGLGLSLLEMASLQDSAELIDWEKYEILDDQVNQRIESTKDRYGDYFVQLLEKMLRNEDQLRSSFAQLFAELLPFQQAIITGIGFNDVKELKGNSNTLKDGSNNGLRYQKLDDIKQNIDNNSISKLNNFDKIISNLSKTDDKTKETEENFDKNIPEKSMMFKKKDCFSVHHNNNNKVREDDPYYQLSSGTNKTQVTNQFQPSSSQFYNKNSLANVWLNSKNTTNTITNSNNNNITTSNLTNISQTRTIKSLTQHASPLYGAPLSKEIFQKSPIKIDNTYIGQSNFSKTISNNGNYDKPTTSTLDNHQNTPNQDQFPAFKLHQNIELSENKIKEGDDKLAETINSSSPFDNTYLNNYTPPQWTTSYPSQYQTFQQATNIDDNNTNNLDTALNNVPSQQLKNPENNDYSQLPNQGLSNAQNISSNNNNLELNSSLFNNQSSTSANLLKYQNLLHAQEASYLADQLQQQQQFSYANTQFTDRSAIQNQNPNNNWNNVFTLNDISNYNFENNKEKIGIPKDISNINQITDRNDLYYNNNISKYDNNESAKKDDISRNNNNISNYGFHDTTPSQIKTTPNQTSNSMINTQPTSKPQYAFSRPTAYSNHTYQQTTPTSNKVYMGSNSSNSSSRCSNTHNQQFSHTTGVVNVQEYLKTPVPVKKIALNLLLQPFKTTNQPQVVSSNQSNSSILSTSTRSIAQQEPKIVISSDEYLQPQSFTRGLQYSRSISPSSIVVRRSITPQRKPVLMNTVVVMSSNASPVVVPRLKQQVGSIVKEEKYYYQPQKQIIDLSRQMNISNVTGSQQNNNNYSFNNSSFNNGIILQGTTTQQQPSPIALPSRLIKSNSSLRVMLSR